VPAQVISVSMDHQLHNGWSMDHQGLPPADIFMACEPEEAVDALLAALADRQAPPLPSAPALAALPSPEPQDELAVATVAAVLRQHVNPQEVCLLRLPLSWGGEMWDFEGPMDFLGYDGGAGIGSGPGMVVGGALALKGGPRLPVAVIGDGDYLMGVTAFWTAAHARLPLLVIVVNNRSYFNDELHQERVARERGRPVENRWIGQRIDDPAPDLARMAQAQGLVGLGPVRSAGELKQALAQALPLVRGGQAVVIDAHVRPGYVPAMSQVMTRSQR
jgi:thiamine pyrophosphate-dependent acetolactate synthase large subunit-like protein